MASSRSPSLGSSCTYFSHPLMIFAALVTSNHHIGVVCSSLMARSHRPYLISTPNTVCGAAHIINTLLHTDSRSISRFLLLPPPLIHIACGHTHTNATLPTRISAFHVCTAFLPMHAPQSLAPNGSCVLITSRTSFNFSALLFLSFPFIFIVLCTLFAASPLLPDLMVVFALYLLTLTHLSDTSFWLPRTRTTIVPSYI